MKPVIAYYTPTDRLMFRLEQEKNPVTRWSLRNIIGNRIDRAEERHMRTRVLDKQESK